MKQNNQKLHAGVWIDNTKAIIITNNSDNEKDDYTIQNKVTAGKQQSVGRAHTTHNAKQTDNLKYYKSVANQLLNYDEILVFGTGKSQEQFKNHLQEDAQFKSKKISIDSAENLTDSQMIAKVRDYFKQ